MYVLYDIAFMLFFFALFGSVRYGCLPSVILTTLVGNSLGSTISVCVRVCVIVAFFFLIVFTESQTPMNWLAVVMVVVVVAIVRNQNEIKPCVRVDCFVANVCMFCPFEQV